MNPKYVDVSTIDATLTHVVEECSEVILEVSKLRRFGPNSFHPDDPERTTNLLRLADESLDLMQMLLELGHHLSEQLGTDRLSTLQAMASKQEKYRALRTMFPRHF